MDNNIRRSLEVLELPANATLEEAKQAYRDLVIVWHPDKHHNNYRLKSKADEKLKQINNAWDKLKKYFSTLDQEIKECDELKKREQAEREKRQKSEAERKQREQTEAEYMRRQHEEIQRFDIIDTRFVYDSFNKLKWLAHGDILELFEALWRYRGYNKLKWLAPSDIARGYIFFNNVENFITQINFERKYLHSDWRLPNLEEYYTLIDYAKQHIESSENSIATILKNIGFKQLDDSCVYFVNLKDDNGDICGVDFFEGDNEYQNPDEGPAKILLVRSGLN